MTKKIISQSTILCLLTFLLSCGANKNKITSTDYNSLNDKKKVSSIEPKNDSLRKQYQSKPIPYDGYYFNLSDKLVDNNAYYEDTVTVRTSEELIRAVSNNRLIRLMDKEYILRSSSYYQAAEKGDTSYFEEKQGLLIDSIKNLKIIGTGSSKLLAYERNATVLKFTNSYNISLDSIIIGHTEQPEYDCEQGVLRVSHSYNIDISNCKLFGSGTFGLVTYDVYNLNFSNSEITECTALIFELEKSRKVTFTNSRFHNNDLSTSVLGGFTNSTKEVEFLHCEFSDNTPKMEGNPAFNFMDNYKDLDEPILFINCTFKNNKGFKWYGEKIKLDKCRIDSSGFIGL